MTLDPRRSRDPHPVPRPRPHRRRRRRLSAEGTHRRDRRSAGQRHVVHGRRVHPGVDPDDRDAEGAGLRHGPARPRPLRSRARRNSITGRRTCATSGRRRRSSTRRARRGKKLRSSSICAAQAVNYPTINAPRHHAEPRHAPRLRDSRRQSEVGPAFSPPGQGRRANTYLCVILIRMAKLTLSVDERVIERAKRYAQARGTSISGLVEQMLDLAASGSDQPDIAPPVLSRLRGSLKGVARTEYHRYLERKHR